MDLHFREVLPAAISDQYDYSEDDADWLDGLVDDLTDTMEIISVSEWAEQVRYLPRAVTPMPGYYRYSVAPYLREIADCFSLLSPVREVDFMKGAQLGATVGVFENVIGYCIEHVKSAPCMMVTADAELAKLRLDGFILPMIQHSGLEDCIQSNDETNARKTGKTAKKLEWAGGGSLLPFGAKNADKLRSVSIIFLLEDEVDAWPEKVGKDGDPQSLVEARTNAFYEVRKIGRISTPLIKNKSRIAKGYENGDQRVYLVPCRSCHRNQELVFQGKDKETGKAFGLVWDADDGQLVPDSVRYLCEFCGHAHRNSDKAWMLNEDNGAHWKPTAKAKNPNHRSYRINALYSPVGMFPWSAIVTDWLECWDVENNTVKDMAKLQEFYNNNLGQPFELFGHKIRFASVSAHRRAEYRLGQVPNHYARQHSGGPILFLTCQVDVHRKNLAAAVMGWTQGMRCYLVDYWRFEVEGDEADCSEIDSPVWQRLRDLIEDPERYEADDGTKYRISQTAIDAGYANDTVTTFCSDYVGGVYPVLGRDRPGKNQTIREFSEFTTQAGTVGFKIVVDHYKDRMAPVLRRDWTEAAGPQSPYHFNAPVDTADGQLRELTVESRREKTDENGNTVYYWHRPGNARNELWDLLGYGHAIVEIFAWLICIQHFELEIVQWDEFWEYAAAGENDGLFGRGTVDAP